MVSVNSYGMRFHSFDVDVVNRGGHQVTVSVGLCFRRFVLESCDAIIKARHMVVRGEVLVISYVVLKPAIVFAVQFGKRRYKLYPELTFLYSIIFRSSPLFCTFSLCCYQNFL